MVHAQGACCCQRNTADYTPSGVASSMASALLPSTRKFLCMLTATWCGAAAAPGTLEAKWRQECLTFSRVKKLDHVADMRIFYVVSQTAACPAQLQPYSVSAPAAHPGMRHKNFISAELEMEVW